MQHDKTEIGVLRVDTWLTEFNTVKKMIFNYLPKNNRYRLISEKSIYVFCIHLKKKFETTDGLSVMYTISDERRQLFLTLLEGFQTLSEQFKDSNDQKGH